MSDASLSDEHFWDLVWRYPPDLWVCLVGAFAGAAERLAECRVTKWVRLMQVVVPKSEPSP
jgi:hypothetical protein